VKWASARKGGSRASSAVLVVGNVSMMLSGLVTAPLTAVALGPSGRGIVVIATLLSSLIVLTSSMGLGWAARDQVSKDPRAAVSLRRRAARLSWVATPLAVVVAIPVLAWLDLSNAEGAAVIVLFAAAGLAATRAVDANILIARDRPQNVGWINVAYSVGMAFAICLLFFTSQLTVATAIASSALGLALQAALLTVFARREIRATQASEWKLSGDRPDEEPVRVREMLRYWRGQLVDAAAARGDGVVMAVSAPAHAVGLYSIAGILTQVGYVVFMSAVQLSFAASPRVSADERLLRLLHGNLLIATALSLLAYPLAYFAIPAVLGADFLGSRGYLLSAVTVLYGLAVATAITQDAARRRASWAPVVAVVASVAAGVASAHMFGFPVAVSTFGGMLVVLGATYAVGRLGRRVLNFDLGATIGLVRRRAA